MNGFSEHSIGRGESSAQRWKGGTRRRSRILALQAIYALDIHGETPAAATQEPPISSAEPIPGSSCQESPASSRQVLVASFPQEPTLSCGQETPDSHLQEPSPSSLQKARASSCLDELVKHSGIWLDYCKDSSHPNGSPRPPTREEIVYARFLVRGTVENLSRIDPLLSRFSEKWSLSRMAAVDRNLLRMAAFELINGKEPPKVILNEAIEIAKIFGEQKTPSFINAMLDKIRVAVQEEAPESAREANPEPEMAARLRTEASSGSTIDAEAGGQEKPETKET